MPSRAGHPPRPGRAPSSANAPPPAFCLPWGGVTRVHAAGADEREMRSSTSIIRTVGKGWGELNSRNAAGCHHTHPQVGLVSSRVVAMGPPEGGLGERAADSA